MSEIEFNIDKENESFRYSKEKEGFDLVKLLLRKGIVKDEKQADILLVVIVVIIIALSFFIFVSSSNDRTMNLTPEESIFFNSSNGANTPAEYDASLFPY